MPKKKKRTYKSNPTLTQSHTTDYQSATKHHKKHELVDVPVIMEQLNNLIKEQMRGKFSDNNCGYMTEFSINSMIDLLSGVPLSERTISLESSIEDTTPCDVTKKYVPIKNEKNNKRVKKQLRVVHSIAEKTETGLHSILPNRETIVFEMDEHSNCKEITSIDLEDVKVPKKLIKSNALYQELTYLAKQSNAILIGQIGLATIGRNTQGHVLAFCATEDSLYYIDGQFYDGISNKGEAVFQDLDTAFNFITQFNVDSTSGFADDCFYLIHRRLPIVYSSEAFDFDASSSSLNGVGQLSPSEPKLSNTIKLEKRKQAEPCPPEPDDTQRIKISKTTDGDLTNKPLLELCFDFEDRIQDTNALARSLNKKNAIAVYIDIIKGIDAQLKYFPANHRLRERQIFCKLSILKCQMRGGLISALAPELNQRLQQLNLEIEQIYVEYMQIPCSQRSTLIASRYHNTKQSIAAEISPYKRQWDLGEYLFKYASNIFNSLKSGLDMSHFSHGFQYNPSEVEWLELALEQAEIAQSYYCSEKVASNILKLIQTIENQLQLLAHQKSSLSELSFFSNKALLEVEKEQVDLALICGTLS